MEHLRLFCFGGALLASAAGFFLLPFKEIGQRIGNAICIAGVYLVGMIVFVPLYNQVLVGALLSGVAVLGAIALMRPWDNKRRMLGVGTAAAVLLLYHGWYQFTYNLNLRYRAELKALPQGLTHEEYVWRAQFFGDPPKEPAIALEVIHHRNPTREMLRQSALEAMERVDALFPHDMAQSVPVHPEEFDLRITGMSHYDGIRCIRTVTVDPKTGESAYLWSVTYFDENLGEESFLGPIAAVKEN